MRRTQRKIYTAGIWVLSLTIIFFGLLAGSVRLLDTVAPEYREDLAAWVSEKVDRRVTIQGMDVGWSWWGPVLQLTAVSLYGDEQGEGAAVHLDALELGFNLFQLAGGQLEPSRIYLIAPRLTVERLPDGSLHVQGLPAGDPDDEDLGLFEAADWIARIGSFRVEEGQLLYRDDGLLKQPLQITDIRLMVESSDKEHQATLSANLAQAERGSLTADILALGDFSEPSSVQADLRLRLQQLDPGFLIRYVAKPGLAVEGEPLDLEVQGELKQGELRVARAQLDIGSMQATRPDTFPLVASPLRADFELSRQDEAWVLDLVMAYRTQSGQRYPTTASLVYLPGAAEGPVLRGKLSQLELGALSPWLRILKVEDLPQLGAFDPRGNLVVLDFGIWGELATPERYALEAEFERVGFDNADDVPGISGLTGSLRMNETGGSARLNTRNGQLTMPEVFYKPVPIVLLTLDIDWQRREKDWRIVSEDLHFESELLFANGRFQLDIPDDGSSPPIDMELRFSGEQAGEAAVYTPNLPDFLDPEITDWLRNSIKGGRVPEGRFVMQGRLEDFPYEKPDEPGVFEIDFRVAEGVLDYADDWPNITGINGKLHFEGRSMRIDADSGRILDTPVGPVLVQIRDYYKPILEVRGEGKGIDAGRQLSFLSESPLKSEYGGVAEALKLSGPADLRLALDIPLEDLEATRADGLVTFSDVTLEHESLPQPVTGLQGQMGFDNRGLHAQGIDGRLLGAPITVQLQPIQRRDREMTRVLASLPVSFPADSERFASLLPMPLLQRLNGETTITVDMAFDASAAAQGIELTAPLQGMALDLPQPLAKPAGEPAQLQIVLDELGEQVLRARASYAELIDLALAAEHVQASDTWNLTGLDIRLNDGEAQQPQGRGLWLSGRLDKLDIDGWRKVLADADTQQTSLALPVREVDLEAGQITVLGQEVADVQVRARPLDAGNPDGGFNAKFSGPSVDGDIDWRQYAGQRPSLRARLDRLVFEPLPPRVRTAADDADKTEPPTDPAQLPGLDIQIKDIRIGDLQMGRLDALALVVEQGLQLDSLRLSGGGLEINADGEWTRGNKLSQASLDATVKGKLRRKLFEVLGYTPSLVADKAEFTLGLQWLPDSRGLVAETLNGDLVLEMEDGRLLAVNPGAGRVLGLLNFYALPRRLTLDFRDVTDKGLAFDELRGNFAIDDGVARTSTLKVRTPSVDIDIEGEVDIAQRTYDQNVTIQPEVSAGVTLAGALLGGPAFGAVLLVAQEVFEKPLEELSRLEYHLGGTWDEPELTEPQDAQGVGQETDEEKEAVPAEPVSEATQPESKQAGEAG